MRLNISCWWHNKKWHFTFSRWRLHHQSNAGSFVGCNFHFI